jgi:hypothetical protein
MPNIQKLLLIVFINKMFDFLQKIYTKTYSLFLFNI